MSNSLLNPLLEITPQTRKIPYECIQPSHVRSAIDGMIAIGLKEIANAMSCLDHINSDDAAAVFSGCQKIIDQQARMEMLYSIVHHRAVAAWPNQEFSAELLKAKPHMTSFAEFDVRCAYTLAYRRRVMNRLQFLNASLEGSARVENEVRIRYLQQVIQQATYNSTEKVTTLSSHLKAMSDLMVKNLFQAQSMVKFPITPLLYSNMCPELKSMCTIANGATSNLERVLKLNNNTVPAILSLCEFQDIRAATFRESRTLCSEYHPIGQDLDNTQLFLKSTNCRLDLAIAKGFDNALDSKISGRVLDTEESIQQWLAQQFEHAIDLAGEERAIITEFANEITAGLVESLEPHDVDFYLTKYKECLCAVPSDVVSSYFRSDSVMTGLFGVATSLFGLEFKSVESSLSEHGTSLTYEVADEKSYIGRINIVFGLSRSSYTNVSRPYAVYGDGSVSKPEISIMLGFGALASFDMSQSNIQSLFHEFGHAIQYLLSEVAIAPLSIPNEQQVEGVEVFSLLFEGLAKRPEILKQCATHKDERPALPDQMLQRIVEANTFGEGLMMRELIAAAAMDFKLSTINAPITHAGQIQSWWKSLNAGYTLASSEFDSQFLTKLTLIQNGSGGNLYCYSLSKAIADSILDRLIDENGQLCRHAGLNLRESYLSKGSSQDFIQSYANFMGVTVEDIKDTFMETK